ncbi:WapI family immunity protein [Arsenicibacter rosenii]|uniref:Uncharacterized protein n=1 Tax=Arsenicibacter rosenii TaxID=1750698 RepID=A0A1S2VLH6_9BACT|nr:hypothetical protein [Arsenicibacter rosenii]OIN59627.1 hypothetical protein BLX24_07065 [Arsenicibacter rosenii]
MKLASSLGSFELSILGYSQQGTNWRDRNNLNCRVSTLWQKNTDTQTAPLQTYELARLLTDLQALLYRKINRISTNFSEPGLSVDISVLPNQTYSCQIQLDHDLTPSWNTYPDFPVEMNMILTRAQLEEMVNQLSRQLTAFPER